MPPPADPANPIEEQENAQDDVEEQEQEEEQEPPAKRAKGMRDWTPALLSITLCFPPPFRWQIVLHQ